MRRVRDPDNTVFAYLFTARRQLRARGQCPSSNVAPTFRASPEQSEGSANCGLRPALRRNNDTIGHEGCHPERAEGFPQLSPSAKCTEVSLGMRAVVRPVSSI